MSFEVFSCLSPQSKSKDKCFLEEKYDITALWNNIISVV